MEPLDPPESPDQPEYRASTPSEISREYPAHHPIPTTLEERPHLN